MGTWGFPSLERHLAFLPLINRSPLVTSCNNVALGIFTFALNFHFGSYLTCFDPYVFSCLHFRYGKVFKSYIFGSPTIISCDLELNKFILQKEGKLFQSSYPKPIRDILGNHSLMIVTDVERHKKLRRIEVGLINKFSSTSNFLCEIDKLCVSLMESWRGNQLILFSKQAKQVCIIKI